MSLPISDTVLVLDAWGVIYGQGDDVRTLLIPYVRESGGTGDAEFVHRLYRETSVGHRTPESFWEAVGLDRTHEDRYLARAELNPEALPFLTEAQHRFAAIACLSNDVGDWSRKLRMRFGLEPYISTWTISGDVGHRKPDAEIYRILIQRLGMVPERLLFVDDRPANLDAARAEGFRTAHYSAEPTAARTVHPYVERLSGVLDLI